MPSAAPIDPPLLRQFFDRSPLSMIITERGTGVLREVNEAFTRLVGHSRDEVIGKGPVELGLLTREAFETLSGAASTRERAHAVELDVNTRSGTSIACRWWVEQADDHLFITAEAVSGLDVGERFKKIARWVPGMLYQLRLAPDGKSSVPYSSEGIRDIFGVEAEQVIDDDLSNWSQVHPDDVVRVGEELQRSARDLTPIVTEYRVRWLNGREKVVLSSAQPEREADGSILWHGFATDVTERKLLEARAAQADRSSSMGQLAAGLSHEVNNPLSYLLLSLQSVMEELTEAGVDEVTLARLREHVDCALDGAERIRRVSQNLSTFTGAGEERQAVDLNAAARAAVTMASNELKFRARLVTELDVVPPVSATASKLSQVVLSLVMHAVRALPEGHVDRHRMTLRSRFEAGWVCVEVEHTGAAFPADQVDRLFDPYVAAGAAVVAGLDLAITKNIVSSFGGEIEAMNLRGGGALLRVRLRPFVEAPRALAATPPLRLPPTKARGRVLVVDDEPGIRKVLRWVLGKEHDLVEAASGREAQRVLEGDQAFDLILCDLLMPEVTGMELHAWLDGHAPKLAERVVFLTGGAFTPTAIDYLKRVKNLRVDKPFEPASLRSLVAEHVRSARA